jgi:RNA polymerase sigma factor (TIGR02999 family)
MDVHEKGADSPTFSSGEPLDALVAALYEELRSAARRQLRTKRRDGEGTRTLATTALVHEAYLKLAHQGGVSWRDRAHFLSVAAVAMRHILVDRARARTSMKRGGGAEHITLAEGAALDEDAARVLEIDEAVHALSKLNPRLSKLVELRFFGGVSEDDAALALGVTVRTIQRDWAKARVLLRHTLAG